jgi:hypothetical protein
MMSKSRKKYAPVSPEADPTQLFCGGKLCITTEAEANARLNGTRKRQHFVHSKIIPKRAYRCPDCGCWHLTSLPKYDDPRDFY